MPNLADGTDEEQIEARMQENRRMDLWRGLVSVYYSARKAEFGPHDKKVDWQMLQHVLGHEHPKSSRGEGVGWSGGVCTRGSEGREKGPGIVCNLLYSCYPAYRPSESCQSWPSVTPHRRFEPSNVPDSAQCPRCKALCISRVYPCAKAHSIGLPSHVSSSDSSLPALETNCPGRYSIHPLTTLD